MGLGWLRRKGNGYFSRVLTWIAAVKLQKFHQLREEQILSDMSVKGALSVTRASEEGKMKNNELKLQWLSAYKKQE